MQHKILLTVVLLVLLASITLAQNMGCSSDRDCLSNYKCISISKPNSETYKACLPNSDEKSTLVSAMNAKAARISNAKNSLNGIVLSDDEQVALSAKSDITTATTTATSTAATATTAPTTSSITLVDKNGAISNDLGAGSANTENDEQEEEENEENDEEENEEEEEEEEDEEDEEEEDEDDEEDEDE